MSESNIIVRVPATLAVGNVPSDLTDHAQKVTYALAEIKKVFASADLDVRIEGEQAIFGYKEDGKTLFVTTSGHDVSLRHHRLQPNGDQHNLEISVDDGETFVFAATFADPVLAEAIGAAWADGRIDAQ